MTYLKIIFYGLLAFIERNPIFCTVLVLIAIFAPVVFHVVGWILLGIIALALLGIGLFVWRAHRMKRQMEKQFRDAMGGNAGNMGGHGFGSASGPGGFAGFASFGNMGGANGMTLEELVRQMQAQADARQRANSGQSTTSTSNDGKTNTKVGGKVGDYVDFEEVK